MALSRIQELEIMVISVESEHSISIILKTRQVILLGSIVTSTLVSINTHRNRCSIDTDVTERGLPRILSVTIAAASVQFAYVLGLLIFLLAFPFLALRELSLFSI